ncbi:MAG: ABC transporter permease subunit [Proteobacteria bacterium]|nr:ABC transporter permease subunit [Pseudomonadota bacterium]
MRRWTLVAIALAGAFSLAQLDLFASRPDTPGSGWSVVGRFLSHALTPAWSYEGTPVPGASADLWPGALTAAGSTLLFAVAALGLALPVASGFGLLASRRGWEEPTRWRARTARRLTRALLATLRSLHELVWALVLLVAVGRIDAAAAVALALPAAGILGKVFAELLDEVPAHAGQALRAAGASSWQVFCFGVLPAALPDLLAYALYRFECAVRASATLGFFGFATLGLLIRQSFSSSHYGEVWAYLYVLLGVVGAVDLWSGAVRRRLVA